MTNLTSSGWWDYPPTFPEANRPSGLPQATSNAVNNVFTAV
ncbi:hypothetical protein NOX27_24230 [Enterobacter kobei]|nr:MULTISPECIES: hypothetical protein [Enterobacteriaceae]MCQ4359411.1 hypothetical protein [Enterobacter kobei]